MLVVILSLVCAQLIRTNYGFYNNYIPQYVPITGFNNQLYYGFIGANVPRYAYDPTSKIIQVGPIISTTNSFGQTRSLVGADGYAISLNFAGLDNIPVYSNAVTNVDYQAFNNNGISSVTPSYSFTPIN